MRLDNEDLLMDMLFNKVEPEKLEDNKFYEDQADKLILDYQYKKNIDKKTYTSKAKIFINNKPRLLFSYNGQERSNLANTLENIRNEINLLEDKYNSNQEPNSQVLFKLTSFGALHFINSAVETEDRSNVVSTLKYFDITTAIIFKTYKKDLMKFYNGKFTSYFTYGLILYCDGVNNNAVYRLVAKLTGEKVSTIRKHYLQHFDSNMWCPVRMEKLHISSYIAYYVDNLNDLIEKNDTENLKSGKNKYDRKVYAAFIKFIEDIKQINKMKTEYLKNN